MNIDTPITRGTILDMTEQELLDHVEKMQAQRMRAYTLYEEGQKLKAEAKDKKDADRLEKVLDMMSKTFVSVDNGLAKLKKYSAEVQVLRLTME